MFRDAEEIASRQPFGPQWAMEGELGQGSYGAVFQVSRNDAGEAIKSAMKWIPLPGDESEIRAMREKGLNDEQIRAYYDRLRDDFVQEIQLLYKLQGNSHIVSIQDYRIEAREGGIGYDLFILMELLTPLPKWIKGQCNLTYREILRLGTEMCDALNDCAKLSILHRDIKPDNIFITSDGRFKLGDFGIARRLQINEADAPQRVGNLGTMSPEVFNRRSYDQRADLYSLGLVLYKLMNAQREPFTPPPPQTVTPDIAQSANARRLAGESLPRPMDLPESLDRLWDVIQKACAYEPEDRFATAEEMRQALLSVQALPALDAAVPLSSEIYAAPKHEDEKQPLNSITSSGSLNETQRRTPSAVDLNRTTGRTPVVFQLGPAAAEDISQRKGLTSVTDKQKKGQHEKKKTSRWLIPLAIGLTLAVAIGMVLAAILSNQSEKAQLTANNATATSVALSWTGLDNEETYVSCFDGDICIRQAQMAESPFVADGLIPSHHYRMMVQDSSQSLFVEADTLEEDRSSSVPVLKRASLATVRKSKLQSVTLDEVNVGDFSFVSDGVISLRTGPMSAQIRSQILWLTFDQTAEAQEINLVISISVPDTAVFSQGYTLLFDGSANNSTFRVPIDNLLDDVYTGLKLWPRDTCQLRLYMNGVSVKMIEIAFLNDA